MVANLGAMVQSVGAGWAMADLGGSPLMIALVQASASLPILLLALPAGALADSRDRRSVMLAAQWIMLVVSGLLTACAATGMLSPWLLLAFTFLVGCGLALKTPAWQAVVGEMVPRPALAAAITMNSMGYNLARSLGPALGGMLVAAFGAAAAFLANTLSYVGLIAVLARWRRPAPSSDLPRERMFAAMMDGLAYVSASPILQRLLARGTMFATPACALLALLPVVARQGLSGGPLTYGLLLGAYGSGAVLGAVIIGPLRRRRSPELVTTLATLAMAAGAAGVGLADTVWLALPACALGGAGWMVALAMFNVAVQMSSPNWVLARSLALYHMSAFGGMALGSALFGVAADAWGLRSALLIAACALAANLVCRRWLPLPDGTPADLAPDDGLTAPSPALSLIDETGPLTISIAYRIPEDRKARFLAVIREQHRICRRDGARRWRLSRDIADPEIWIEHYMTSNWSDYLRHNRRRTLADISITQTLLKLHAGSHPPQVQRTVEQFLPAAACPGSRIPDFSVFSSSDTALSRGPSSRL